jgi:hypothetical protein
VGFCFLAPTVVLASHQDIGGSLAVLGFLSLTIGDVMQTTLIAIGALFLSPIFLANAAAPQTPGQFNTYSTPNGAYVGQPPAYTSQLPNGAPVLHTPGQLPIFGTPTPNGGYVIHVWTSGNRGSEA